MTSSLVVDHRIASLAEIFSQGPSEYEKGWLSLPARSKNQKIRTLKQKGWRTDAITTVVFRRGDDPCSKSKFCCDRNKRDQSCDTHRFERSLVLHQCRKYETRRESDAKISTSPFGKQGLLHSSLNPSAWVLLSQQPQTRAHCPDAKSEFRLNQLTPHQEV